MKLFFRKYGNGPPFIILHGLYGSSDNWVTIAKRISDSFTVYLPDLRNHGQSPHSNVHDYESMSNDLFELVNDLKIDRFILAGHSMGGKVAMKFALKWPEKLNSLIVIDISPFGSHDRENIIFRQHLEILETILSVKPEELNGREDVDAILTKRIDSEKIRGLIMKNLRRTDNGTFIWKMNADSLLSNIDYIMEGILPPDRDIHRVTGFDVIFVRGELSDYLPESEMKKIQKIFPAAEMMTIKNAGHWVHAEKPDAITDLFLKMIDT
jgi:esterase